MQARRAARELGLILFSLTMSENNLFFSCV